MALPDLIEIEPWHNPIQACVTVPGSKSITNRALILAALAEGKTTLRGALWSEDTQVMCDCLQRLGFTLSISSDPGEPSNRHIEVHGCGGRIPLAGTRENPLELFVGNAGTAARFLAAFVCLGNGFYRLHGIERMHSRPQAALFEALRQLGYSIASASNKLPAVIEGTGPRNGLCSVQISESSQFASALLLCGSRAGWTVQITGRNEGEMPYVEMTRRLIQAFPANGGTFTIEPDASSASYFCAADWIARQLPSLPGCVKIRDFPDSDWQIDAAFPRFLPPITRVSRRTDLGDAIMTAIVLATLGNAPAVFSDLEPLRLQECERVAALRTELTRCGAAIREEGQSLIVTPGPTLHGAEIETYNDHRMAMCFAILGLKVPGIRIKNPGCVKKTFPNFFQKLADRAENGGLGIRVSHAGRILTGHELISE
jgi:3-phosphoshikimate 1-carboxyvinyltransferase